MRSLVAILITLTVLSCETTNSESEAKDHSCQHKDSVKPKTDFIPSSWKSFKPKFGCYYLLDDKYSDVTSPEIINAWWDNKIDTIIKYGIGNNLFDHYGGGPNGAEWNASAHLLFVASYPDTLDLEVVYKFTVKINQQTVSPLAIRTENSPSGLVSSFMISQNDWTKMLRPIETDDYPLL